MSNGVRWSAFAVVIASWSTAGTMLASASETSLVLSARRGDVSTAQALVAQGANVDESEPDGTTALHWAAQRENLTLVDLLIGAGADVNRANRYGVTPLSLAATNGSAALLDRLLQAGADVHASLPGGETALHTAARTGRVDAVRVLLAHGAKANVDQREETHGQTPLMWAAAAGYPDVMGMLLEFGADLHVRSTSPEQMLPPGIASGGNNVSLPADWEGPPFEPGQMTALLFAVRRGHQDAVRLLLDAGADVNDEATFQETYYGTSNTVTIAVSNGHYELAALLLDRGADPNHAGQGWTALHQMAWARSERHRSRANVGYAPTPFVTGSMSGLELARKLVAHGVNVNERTALGLQTGYRVSGGLSRVGVTPFWLAAKVADLPLMTTLRELGADIESSNVDGVTPLGVVAGIGNKIGEDSGEETESTACVEALIAWGADVHAADKYGYTALHVAAMRGANEMVKVLVDAGARLDRKTGPVVGGTTAKQPSLTPLMIANGAWFTVFYRHLDTAEYIAELMRERGIPVTDTPADGLQRGGANTRIAR